MMNRLYKIALLSVPFLFISAGSGMLWLNSFEQTPGSFFEQLTTNGTDWVGAHIILLFSTILLVPAALAIRSFIEKGRGSLVADLQVIIVGLTATLLAGQYAIDFVMPLLAEVGGEALEVHRLLYSTSTIDTLFYKLPNLVFLALMVLTFIMLWSAKVPRVWAIILIVNWLAVLLGNLVHPVFQRVAIFLLGLSYGPLIWHFWNPTSTSDS